MTVVNINDVKLSDAERQPCEIWTRVMGYLRPVSDFTEAKAVESCACGVYTNVAAE